MLDKTKKIRLLPEHLINRIAAGEVVERPSSILKELIENSLDAGADSLEISVINGGKKSITIKDNGFGMTEEELFMCLERHATSKLKDESDLFNISTLGFRGEALPSISSVAKVLITSACEDGDGHSIKVNGGKVEYMKPAAANRGTVIAVSDLFYNVPARRKFLKTENTENNHLLEVAYRYALARNDLSLKYFSNMREIFAVDSQSDFLNRIYKILGEEAANNMFPFNFEREDFKLSGYIGHPKLAVSNSNNIFIYVLGRPVKDKLLNKAVSQAYGTSIPSGRWPKLILFLKIPYEEVDVNVHPAKTEVRFRNPSFIFRYIVQAIEEGLANLNPLKMNNLTNSKNMQNEKILEKPVEKKQRQKNSLNQNFGESFLKNFKLNDNSIPRLEKELTNSKKINNENAAYLEEDTKLSRIANYNKIVSSVTHKPLNDFSIKFQQEFQEFKEEKINNEENFANKLTDLWGIKNIDKNSYDEIDLKNSTFPLAQLNNSYILAQGVNGLYLIDQHAAHERILYNKLRNKIAKEGLLGQNLLFPVTIEATQTQILVIEKLIPYLKRIGFSLKYFGGETFVLKTIPAILGNIDPYPVIIEIINFSENFVKDFEGAGIAEKLNQLANSWTYSLACRAAIKFGDKLSMEEMQKLIDDLSEEQMAGFCPHGRVSVISIAYNELAKKFNRM